MNSFRVDRNSVISFLIISPGYHSDYYFDLLTNLQLELKNLGHEARIINRDVDCTFLNKLIQKENVNVVLQINALRNRFLDLPKNTIFISWFQDIFPGDESFIDENIADDNYIVTLGDPEILGFRNKPKNFLGTLYSGVSDRNLSIYSPQSKHMYSATICGFIPHYSPSIKRSNFTYETFQKIPYPLNTFYKTLVNGSLKDLSYFYNRMSLIVDLNYTPLSGSLDISELEAFIRSDLNFYDDFRFTHWAESRYIMARRKSNFFAFLNIEKFLIEKALFFFTQTYPRYLDRDKLFRFVEQKDHNLKVFGNNWNKYEAFANNWGGIIQSKGALWNLYKNSKINYTNNTHGLALHSRVLECMASGGLVAMHRSKRDHLDGGVLSSFQEGEHFLFYDNLNFNDLVNNKALHLKITKNAFEIVKEKHTWSCRAKHLVSMVNNKFRSNL
jgi:hypothetical protein